MSSTANLGDHDPMLASVSPHATGARLISRLLLRPQPPRALPAAESAAKPDQVASLDREQRVCIDLEAAMMAIVVAGAALFGAGLLTYGLAEGPWTIDGIRALRSIAVAAGAFAIWSVLSGLVGLARAICPPAG